MTLRSLLPCVTLIIAGPALAAEFDSSFDWVAAGAAGPLFDSETQEGFDLTPGDYVVSASLERTFKILTFRTQVGMFLYGDELPLEERESAGYALLSAMDRFGEGRWALVVLGGVGYYDANRDVNLHVGLMFDYRVKGQWLARGEAIYHHEFGSVAASVGIGYIF